MGKHCSYKGIYTPANKEKYVGANIDNIIYRSKLEYRFMVWCDSNPNILQWASECIVIPYCNPIKVMKGEEGINANYYPDFWIKFLNKNGDIEQAIVEIKPKDETMPPKPVKRKTKGYLAKLATYAINEAKWIQTRKFCEKSGIKFIILTEEWIQNNAPVI